jgi:hypothetical protein
MKTLVFSSERISSNNKFARKTEGNVSICLFHVAFPDVFITVYIHCLLCVNIENNFEPTVCEEKCLTYLSIHQYPS